MDGGWHFPTDWGWGPAIRFPSAEDESGANPFLVPIPPWLMDCFLRRRD
jgi:hypothetical protein